MAVATFVPSSYDQTNSNHAGTDSTNTPSNGLTAATSETRAAFTSNTTANSTTSIYYNFDCSSIPQNVTINSVSCDFKATCSSNYFNTRVGQLCTGTTKKGSGTTITNTSINNTVNVQTISNTGSWTRAELNNIKILIEAVRGSSTSAFTISFFGATLTVDYTVNGKTYDVTSVLSTNAVDSIDPAGLTEVQEGENYQLEIHAASLDDFKVEDNGVNVTSQLVQHNEITSGTINAKPETTPTTEVSVSGAGFYTSSSSQTTVRFSDAVGHTAESPATMPSSNQWTYVKDGNNNNATGWAIYNFDFSSIPANATITSVSVKCYGAKENTSSGSQYQSKIGLYSGTTLKSTEQQFTSSSASIMTISSPGTWTRAELQNAKLRFTVAYYGGWLGGVTWTVNYTVPSVNPYYWTYSLSNVAADHTIVISDAVIEIPEEDPQYEYYPITISSINATTDPGRGTIRVVEGTDTTITIYPDDPLVTLITDNGVNVSSQLVAHGGTIPDPTVSTASGASYGFTLNQNTGYYVSANKGVDKSAAVCRVDFNLPVRCLVTIQYINYAEATYDFGVFGNIDVALSNNYYAAGSGGATITDSNYKLACSTSQYNTSSQQTLTYEIEAGQHFIDIKYSKDDATDSNNDTLQWKIDSIETLEANNYYTYTLSNIQEDHSLIFIFGDVTYYINQSGGTNCKLFPSGSMVALPGDTYQLTIVPNNYSFEVGVTDNNVNVTSSVERVEQEVTKDGNTYTVVNYIYTISNVQSNHNIYVTCNPTSLVYIKLDDRWALVNALYEKVNGVWVEETGSISAALSSSNKIFFFNNQ